MKQHYIKCIVYVMFFEKIINIFDLYHQKRILNYIKKFNLKYLIDVGAHKGEFLSYILSLNLEKIYCFEPQNEIFNLLYQNFKKFKEVEFFNEGLSDQKSVLPLYVNKLTSTSTFSKSKNTFFFKFKNFILNTEKSYTKINFIETKTLDEIFINKNINNVFLKIDVEGFELNVLMGAEKILVQKVKFVLVERHFFQLYKNNLSNEVDLFLKKNNFTLIKKFTFPLFHFQDNLYIKE